MISAITTLAKTFYISAAALALLLAVVFLTFLIRKKKSRNPFEAILIILGVIIMLGLLALALSAIIYKYEPIKLLIFSDDGKLTVLRADKKLFAVPKAGKICEIFEELKMASVIIPSALFLACFITVITLGVKTSLRKSKKQSEEDNISKAEATEFDSSEQPEEQQKQAIEQSAPSGELPSPDKNAKGDVFDVMDEIDDLISGTENTDSAYTDDELGESSEEEVELQQKANGQQSEDFDFATAFNANAYNGASSVTEDFAYSEEPEAKEQGEQETEAEYEAEEPEQEGYDEQAQTVYYEPQELEQEPQAEYEPEQEQDEFEYEPEEQPEPEQEEEYNEQAQTIYYRPQDSVNEQEQQAEPELNEPEQEQIEYEPEPEYEPQADDYAVEEYDVEPEVEEPEQVEYEPSEPDISQYAYQTEHKYDSYVQEPQSYDYDSSDINGQAPDTLESEQVSRPPVFQYSDVYMRTRVRTIIRRPPSEQQQKPAAKRKPATKASGGSKQTATKASKTTAAKQTVKQPEPIKTAQKSAVKATPQKTVTQRPVKKEPVKAESAVRQQRPQPAASAERKVEAQASSLPLTRKYIILNRHNAAAMFNDYLNTKREGEKEELTGALNTIIIK